MFNWFWGFSAVLATSLTRRKDIATMEWLIGFLTAVFITVFGYLLTQQQRKYEKRDEQIEAVAALRFELQSNLEWMDDIFESKIYLRDEAWCTLKNKGYISYLVAPIPMKVITTYEKIHLLNEQIHILISETESLNLEKLQKAKVEAHNEIGNLIKLLDVQCPRIGKNFEHKT